MRLDSLIAKTAIDPRPYQRRIIAKALNMFQGRHKDGAGEITPANGKSEMVSPRPKWQTWDVVCGAALGVENADWCLPTLESNVWIPSWFP